MPKGYPVNPELTRIRRSIAAKKIVRTPEWYEKVREILVKRNKSSEHIAKVKKANTGVKFTEERKLNQRLNHADTRGEKNPNWRGDKVGVIGVHVWLKKFYIKKRICEHCGLNKEGLCGTDWALIKGKNYERKRENFMELCRKCHAIYDKTKEFCKNGHKMIPENLYRTKTRKRSCRLCNKIYRDRSKYKGEWL